MEAIFNQLHSAIGGEITEKRKIAESEVGTSWIIEITENNAKKSTVFLKCSSGEENSELKIYFRNEHVFYNKILSEFTTLGSGFTTTAKCIDAGRNYLALEDIIAQGYKPFDIKESLSVEKVKTIVKYLGEFHAFSFALKERSFQEYQELGLELQETVFTLEKKKVFTFAMHDALKLVKQSLPKNSVYIEKLSVFTLNIFEKMSELAKGDIDEDHVFTHGDLWINNILINKNNEVKFVDFNSCRLSSPVHDLMLLLLTGLETRFLEECLDEIILTYHNSLCVKLQQMKCDPLMVFPFSSLQKQLREYSRFSLATALAGLPLLMDDGSPVQIDQDGDPLMSFIQKIHARKSMRCKNKIIEIVMYIVNQGYLD